MVAVVSANGLGLFNSSLTQLGTLFGGQAGIGQSGASQMVNIANGNLVLQDVDDSLDVRGFDTQLVRTYNSQGVVSGVGQDGFVTGYERSVALTSGTVDTAGSVMTLSTGDGQSVAFTYNATTGQYTTTAGSGASDTLVRNVNGSVVTWVYTNGSTREQDTYADYADPVQKGRLLKMVQTTTDGTTPAEFDVLYNTAGLITQISSVDGTGSTTTNDAILFAYSTTTPTQLISVTTRANGVTESEVSYGYDTYGRLSYVQTDLTPTVTTNNTWSTTASANDGLLYRTTYTYVAASASNLQIASVTTSDGVTVSYTYDTSGRVKTVTQGTGAAAQTVTFAYNTGNTTVTDGAGRVWTYQYNTTSDQLTAVIDPIGETTAYTYTAAGKVASISQTASGASTPTTETIYEYDSNGNVLLRRDLLGDTTTWTYNAANQVLSQTQYTTADPKGLDAANAGSASGAETTYYVYDAQNRLNFTIDATGEVTEQTYATSGNGIGQVASVRQYLGGTYTVPTGGPTLALLTAWATAAQLANSTLSTYSYDVKGRLQQVVNYDAVDTSTTDGTSGAGVLDAGTAITHYVYNAQNQILQKVIVRGATRTVTGTAPATSQATTYTYDGMGRLLGVLSDDPTNPSGGILTSYAYTDSADQIQVTYASGLVQTQLSNSAGQVISVSRAGLVGSTQTTRTTQMYYDNTGRMIASQDATGVLTYYFYDADGRLAETVDGTGAVTQTVYDGLSRVTETIGYATPISTTGWYSSSTNTVTLPTSLVFAATQPTLTTGQFWIPTSTTGDRYHYQSYDAAGRLSTQTDAIGTVTTYAYDGASNLRTVTQTPPSGDTTDVPRVTTYYYDADNRQIGVVDPGGYLTESFYDDASRVVKTIRYATATTAGATLAVPAATANDLITRYFHDGRGQLVGQLNDVGGTTTAATGYLTTYTYNEQLNQTSEQAYSLLLTGLAGTETLASLQATATAAVTAGTATVQTTLSSYNALGQLVSQTNPEGTVTLYNYDSAGRLVWTQADQNGGATLERDSWVSYDAFGDVTGTISGEQAAQAEASLGTGRSPSRA